MQQFALLAGDTQPFFPAWNQLKIAPGNITANNLELNLSGLFTNKGGLSVSQDLYINAAQGIDNSGAAIRAGGYLQLQGGGLNNANGSIEAGSLLAVLAGDLDNTRGRIQIAGLN